MVFGEGGEGCVVEDSRRIEWEVDLPFKQSVNWIAEGRFMRHCSSWWWSSALTAGKGKVPESAGGC